MVFSPSLRPSDRHKLKSRNQFFDVAAELISAGCEIKRGVEITFAYCTLMF